MKVIVKSRVPAKQCRQWAGKHPEADHYSFVAHDDIDVYAPDGTYVLGLRRKAIRADVLEAAYPHYHWMRKFTTDNRGKYSGLKRGFFKDGSKNTRTFAPDGGLAKLSSGIAGYYEASGGRFPYCRATAMLLNYPERWEGVLPCVEQVANVFKQCAPAKYKHQMQIVSETDPAWVISGTPFTTLTINNCVAAAYHQDKGDLKSGMGAMLVMRRGEYRGFELVIPEYRFAVDMHHGDVIVFNPVIWHGNRPVVQAQGEKVTDWERISVVHYYRKGITGCQSPEAELDKAKQRGAV
jgi:hypothetical protein